MFIVEIEQDYYFFMNKFNSTKVYKLSSLVLSQSNLYSSELENQTTVYVKYFEKSKILVHIMRNSVVIHDFERRKNTLHDAKVFCLIK